MKVTLIQPRYCPTSDAAAGAKNFAALLSELEKCDETSDVIVLPEYSNLLYNEADPARFFAAAKENRAPLTEAAKRAAVRCGATVFYNILDETPTGVRNVTRTVDRTGKTVGKYEKAHPAPSEVRTPAEGGHGLDVSYSYEYREPTTVTVDGVKYAFITCYDAYFYEYYPQLARVKPDVIVACSLQRTDLPDALETFGKFLCYNTNAYLFRASASLGEDSATGGCGMVVSPRGEVLLNLGNRVGAESVEVDINAKYEKPAGFGGKPTPHWVYAEEGRRPWLYRPAGAATIPDDRHLPYPRLCAHRGFSAVAPENSLPAWGAAVALGAQEIEFDVWATRDGVLVSCHDDTVDRVSDGTGKIWEHTYEELLQYDFGVKHGEHFKGLKIVRFEEILRKFARQVILNIHVKIWEGEHYSNPYYREIGDLIRKYDCQDHCYMMSAGTKGLAEFRELYPEIRICQGYHGPSYLDDAIRIGADKIQLFKPYFDEEMIRRAHEHGILCNVFFADDPDEARRYLDMGVDCILTNDYLKIKTALGI